MSIGSEEHGKTMSWCILEEEASVSQMREPVKKESHRENMMRIGREGKEKGNISFLWENKVVATYQAFIRPAASSRLIWLILNSWNMLNCSHKSWETARAQGLFEHTLIGKAFEPSWHVCGSSWVHFPNTLLTVRFGCSKCDSNDPYDLVGFPGSPKCQQCHVGVWLKVVGEGDAE